MISLDDERIPVFVGLVTLAAGSALTIAPRQVGPALSLGEHPEIARAIGVSDLVLVPGLLRGRPRWPWMLARAGLNLVIAAHYRRVAAEPGGPAAARLGAAALVGLTAVDGATAVALRSAGR